MRSGSRIYRRTDERYRESNIRWLKRIRRHEMTARVDQAGASLSIEKMGRRLNVRWQVAIVTVGRHDVSGTSGGEGTIPRTRNYGNARIFSHGSIPFCTLGSQPM